MTSILLVVATLSTIANTNPRTMTEEELFSHIDKNIMTKLPTTDKWNAASKSYVQAVWLDFKSCHLNPSHETRFSSIFGKIADTKDYNAYVGTYSIHYPIQSKSSKQPLKIYKKGSRFFVEMQGLKLPAIARNRCIFFTSGQVVFSDLPRMGSGAHCRLVINMVMYSEGKYYLSEVSMPSSAWDTIGKISEES
jgi:hypothetical protein